MSYARARSTFEQSRTSTSRRQGWQATLVAGGLLLFSACTAPSLDSSQVRLQPSPVQQSTSAAHPTLSSGSGTTRFDFTGHTESVVVPEGVVAAQVKVAGAQGSNANTDSHPKGTGAIVTGSLSVNPGDVLTLAVGGKGQAADKNKNPGAGGWSLPPFEGGKGGGGHGAITTDGSGGGGASVIQRDGNVVVVAGAGGGAGGQDCNFDYCDEFGGFGGAAAGGRGEGGTGHQGGKGGSFDEPHLNKTGKSYSGALIQGGGGGGGGGYHSGGGGAPRSVVGSDAGGGGSSLYASLIGYGVVYDKNTDVHAPVGNQGDGSIDIVWHTALEDGTTYTIATQESPSWVLAATNPDDHQPGSAVSLSKLTSSPRPDQQWIRSGQTFTNKSSGLCLEVNGASWIVDQWTCDPEAPNHQWDVSSTGLVRLTVSSGLERWLDVETAPSSTKTAVVIVPPTNVQLHTVWVVEEVG